MRKYLDLLQRINHCKTAFALGLAVMVTMIISPGSLVQEALFALVDLDAFTFYQAVHGESINRQLPLSDWLKMALKPEFLAIAFAASIWAVTRTHRSSFIVAIWIIVATGLTVHDVVSAAQLDALTTGYAIKNIFSNLAGSAFVASLAALSLGLTDKFASSPKLGLVFVTIPSLIGLAVSLVLYFSVALFTHLIPATAVISLEGAVSGYISRGKPAGSVSQSSRSFALIPEDLRFERLQLAGSDNLAVRWERTRSDTEFSLSVHLVDTCWSSSDLDKETVFPPLFESNGVTSVELAGDVTSKQLQVLGDQSQLVISESPISSFSIENDQAISSLSITEFLSQDALINASTDGAFSIRLTGATLVRNEDTTELSAKHFILRINDEERRFELLPPATLSDEKISECTFLDGKANDSGVFVLEDVVMGGLLLRLERTSVPTGYVNDRDGLLHIENANGWMTLPTISLADLRSSGGRIDFLSFSSPSSEVVIDGVNVDMSAGQNLAGFGNLFTRYRNDGVLLATGELKAAWSEGRRLNQTRWEILPTELRISLLTAFGAFLLWAVRRLTKVDWSVWSRKKLLGITVKE